ncbi:hypothetical protein GCK72_008364 [Caenorhabditis remanei]|uniref:MULE transposase domain-containing protein n=1 Tax=Caenorhabditis remanei TaxID=31234 RepID=A0A6A5GXD7_CAERE|nr:hypothetical protein GCK72_008364 [Caenorhabditis remanei]KAF1760118.1 hypothetical protein GCK72_008364 [Caenorhabditis remanei]
MPKNRKRNGELVDGWFMRKKKNIPSLNESIFYCIERSTKYQCPAAYGVSNTTGAVRLIRPHINHEKDKLANNVNLGRQHLKENANSGTVREVIDDMRFTFGTDTSMMMGDYNAKRRLVHYEKSQSNSEKKLIDSGGKIKGQFAETMRKTRFLLFDEEVNGKRMIAFASDEGLEILSNGNVCFVDGTFDSAPKSFTQLFSIHCYISEDVVRPVFFCLLPDKTLTTYTSMLTLLKNRPELTNWAPAMIICDFETAIHSAFKDKFPNVVISGCLFHLVQSWRRQAEKLNVYNSFVDGEFEEFWQLLKTLPFLDEFDIPDYFDAILEHCVPLVISPDMKNYINYLVKNYVGDAAPPRFQPRLWSCAVRTASNIHRTTNTVETWHRLLQSVATMHNGFSSIKLSDLLEKLQKEERHTYLDYNELKVNPNFLVNKARKTSNVMKDKKLKNVIENIPVIPRAPLSGIAYLKAIFYAKKT